MFRTFLAIQRVNLGFDPRGLLTFRLLGNIGNKPRKRRRSSANFATTGRDSGVHNVTVVSLAARRRV